MGNWTWTGRYILAMVVALILGVLLGELSLFHQTTLGASRLTAAGLAKFIAFGGALLLLWLLGQGIANQLRQQRGRLAFLGRITLPFVTLLVVWGAYSVLLFILQPFFSQGAKNAYNWFFVLAITGSALWLAASIFYHSEPLIELVRSGFSGKRS